MLIKQAIVIPGNALPAYGPVDILIDNGRIARIGSSVPDVNPVPGTEPIPGTEEHAWPSADAVIDARGKYVMPGIVDTHVHWATTRVGPIPIQYAFNLYLAAGVTTAREVGTLTAVEHVKKWRADSAAHRIVAPRMLWYPFVHDIFTDERRYDRSPAMLRQAVRAAHAHGADGVKLMFYDRDQAAAIVEEAKKLGLRTAVHIGASETNAADYARLGVTTIEHFYGVADAALNGVQHLPPWMNYNNELQRFAYAGQLYLEPHLDRAKLSSVLDTMVQNGVGWSVTLAAYDLARDPLRTRNLPWYKDYLHPALEEFHRESLARHGSYSIGWTNTLQVSWRRTYRVWMDAIVEFARKGGLVTVGDDAGFGWGQDYGFAVVRELELQEEAGFQPIEVIRNATVNGATVLGLADRLGRIREGYIADLLVINGNPLLDLSVLNPYGVESMLFLDGRHVAANADLDLKDPKLRIARGGGVEWTIKDGIPYHVPTLLSEVRDMVSAARAQRDGK